MRQTSPVTVAKWVWWLFLPVAPLLALFLLGFGWMALPLNLVVTAIPVYATHRLLQNTWRTRKVVVALYALLIVAAVLLVALNPTRLSSALIPEWISSLLGAYFIAAPLLMTGAALFELHRVSFHAS